MFWSNLRHTVARKLPVPRLSPRWNFGASRSGFIAPSLGGVVAGFTRAPGSGASIPVHTLTYKKYFSKAWANSSLFKKSFVTAGEVG